MESSDPTLEKTDMRSKNLFHENNINPKTNSDTNIIAIVTLVRAHICHLLCAIVLKDLYVWTYLILTIVLTCFIIIIIWDEGWVNKFFQIIQLVELLIQTQESDPTMSLFGKM